MVVITQSPTWFKTAEVLIDLFSVAVSFMIAYYSIKYFRVNKQRNLLYFCLSFLLFGLSHVCKTILQSGILYNWFIKIQHYGGVHYVTSEIIPISPITNVLAFFYVWLTLYSFFLLYLTVRNEEPNLTHLLLFILYGIIAYLNTSHITFHLLNVILLIYTSIRYWYGYLKTRRKSIIYSAIAVVILTASQFFFIFINIPTEYVIGEFLQLVGFFILMVVILGMNRERAHVKTDKG